LDQLYHRVGISHFHRQLAKLLVMEINHDGLLWMMGVPEQSLAILIEGACSDDSGHIGSGQPDDVVPAVRDLRVGSNARDVDKRDFQTALECPELVSASNVQRQFPLGDRQIDPVLWNWGLKRVPASQAGIFLNLEPLVGVILGVSLLHEQLGIMALAGGALIIVGAVHFSYKPEGTSGEVTSD
jgi:EamA-like transporter family